MITSDLYKGKKIAVLGKGKAGNAAIASLKASGAEVYSWDDVAFDEGDTHYDEWPWEELYGLVMSPGIPLTHPKPHPAAALALAHRVEILGDVELLYRAQSHAKYIGITGTNGKSTTTALIGHILEEAGLRPQVGGNLGTPAMALDEADIYVLEMSSYQLDLMVHTRFDIAVWLNISPDHIDRHGDLKGYINAKKHIFDRQMPSDVAVIGGDDEYGHTASLGCHGHVVYISMTDPIHHEIGEARGLQGYHNHQNAAAAYAVCRELGVSHDDIVKHMHTFPGLPHRMQYVAEHNGVKYINDSKATNADAAEKSLMTFENIYWLAGGVSKAGDIAPLHLYFPLMKCAYFYGQDASVLAATYQDHEQAVYETLDEAFAAAHEDAQAAGGGVVLLAPACASFDQYKSFEHRGDHFCELVKKAISDAG